MGLRGPRCGSFWEKQESARSGFRQEDLRSSPHEGANAASRGEVNTGEIEPRLLRTGLVMVGSAAALWLFIIVVARLWSDPHSDPVAQVLVLTFTILLWPFGTLGLLVLACWLLLRLAGFAHIRR
jgi:hypothetical protein